MYEQIRHEVSVPTATITLNRPHALNAWTELEGVRSFPEKRPTRFARITRA